MTLFFSISAIILYLSTAGYQLGYLFDIYKKPQRKLLIGAGLLAVLCHSLTLLSAAIDFGFFNIASLIFWFISLLVILSTLKRPTDNLLVALFPLAAIAILTARLNDAPHNLNQDYDVGLLLHIISSILAYSILTIASMQALALSLQDYQLKHHRLKGLLNKLPPLQTMENMLFELLWLGVGLLTLSILSGLIFLEDIFAQHLAHKSALTIAAWCIFSTLLWGHKQLGWRSQTAVKWTLVGFTALMLGYFGSKFVLELLL